MSRASAHISLQIIVLLWGCTALLGQHISIHAVPLVWYRVLMVVVLLAVYVPARAIPLRIPLRAAARYAGIGMIIGAHWLCFYGAIKVAGIATAVLSLSTITFFTALLEPAVFRRPVAASELVIGGFVVAGAALLLQLELHVTAVGLTLGLGSAILAAVFGVLNGKLAHDERPERLMLYELAGAFLLVSAFVPWQFVTPSSADLGWLAILAVACTVIPQVWIIYVMRRLSPFTVAVTVNLEPVYSLILAAVLLGQTLTPRFYAGAALLFALVIVNGLRRARSRAPATAATTST